MISILKKIKNSYNHYINKKKEYNLFVKGKTLKNNKDYFSVNPMPNDSELRYYYKNIYKKNSNFRNQIIDERALIHFNIIEKMNISFSNFLNIGSNTGGVSHLFRAKGKTIYNFDFFKIKRFYDQNWNFVSNLDDLNNKIDFIYMSHSLEHFININELFSKLNKLIHENTYIFIEVPNGENEKAGGLKRIMPPHLHYFKRDFFENLNKNIIKLSLSSIKKTDDIEYLGKESKNHKFIVYIGKGKFNINE